MKIADLTFMASSVIAQKPDGQWVPARPITRENNTLWARLKCAYKVLVNRADIVEWE